MRAQVKFSRPRLRLVPLALVVLGGVLVGGAPAVQARPSGDPATFTDPSGDSGAAGDIVSIAVSNDANGQITFQVDFGNTLPSTATVDVLIDSDNNPSTGASNLAGVEYDLSADIGSNSVGLGYWNGSTWVDAPSSSTLTGGHTNTQQTFTISKSDLGGTSAFNFWVDSSDGGTGAGHEDQAPNDGTWHYALTSSGSGSTGMHLAVLLIQAAKTVKAGSTYTAGMAVQRSDTGGLLGSEGELTCKATAAGKPLDGVGSFVTITHQGGKVSAAFCLWHIPKQARGKTIHGTITASYQGAQVSKTINAQIK
jgi:hypothetical protein